IKRIGGGVGSFTIDRVSVKEIIGRPLTQPTTGFKPKLRRVPKRLGQELVTNGNFAANSDWVGSGGTVAISGGVLTLTSTGVGFAARAMAAMPMNLNVGATYVLAVNTPSGGSFRLGSTQGLAQLYSSPVLPAGYTAVNWVATADQAYITLTGSSTSGVQNTFTQASVREVLEWGWAWVFDGVDDILSTASLPAGTDETIMVCATSLTNAGTARAPIGKRNLNNGLFLRRESGGALNGNAMTGSGFGPMTLETPHVNFSPFVATVSAKSGASRGRLNGTQKATTAGVYAGWAGPLGVGSEKGTDSGTQWSGYVFAAAYIPGTPTDAELLIIERAMAQLAGVTI
ncbi:hypothetical protein, partial [Vogesella mureinivorans]|uniref:hypothetical protein n=1 Tax=Vogesella mureinivorans TaxID=657276 RepID=UPI001478B2B7